MRTDSAMQQPVAHDGGQGDPGDANPGQPGPCSMSSVGDADYAAQVAGPTNMAGAFVHLVLLRAYGAYQLGPQNPNYPDSDSIALAIDKFQWLMQLGKQAVTPTLYPIAKSDPTVIITIPPAPVDILKQVGQQAGHYLRQINGHRDAFGHLRTYMPTLSFETCLDFLSNSTTGQLEIYEKIYDAWRVCANEIAAQAKARDRTVNALVQAKAQSNTATVDIDTQSALNRKLNQQIMTQQVVVAAEAQAVQDALTKAVDDITKQMNGCDIGSLIRSLGQLAFMPELGAAEAGGAATAGFASQAKFAGLSLGAPILADAADAGKLSGQDCNKILMINQIDSLGTEVTDLSGLAERSGPFIKADDPKAYNPNAYKLLAGTSQLEEKLQQFSSIPGVATALTTVHTYIADVQQQNQLILEYNGGVSQVLTLLNHQQRLGMLEGTLTTTLAGKTIPGQVQYLQYLFFIVQTARNRCLQALNDAIAAYNVSALDDKRISDFLTGPNLTIDDVTPTTIHNALGELQNQKEAAVSVYQQNAPLFPITELGADEIVVEITDETVLQNLKDTKTTRFALRAPHVDGEKGNNPDNPKESPFGNWFDIRMTSVSVKLPSASRTDENGTPNAPIIANISASPTQHFVDLDDQLHIFTTIPPKQDIEPYGFQCTVGTANSQPISDTYERHSPFTTWVLEIPNNMNKGTVDLSNVKQILLTFRGSYRPRFSTGTNS